MAMTVEPGIACHHTLELLLAAGPKILPNIIRIAPHDAFNAIQ